MIQLKTRSLGSSTLLAVSHDTALRALAGATPVRRCLSRQMAHDIFFKTNNRRSNAVVGNASSMIVCSASVQVRDMRHEWLYLDGDSCLVERSFVSCSTDLCRIHSGILVRWMDFRAFCHRFPPSEYT